MKKITVTALVLAIAATSASAAQLYRWVDEKGNVEWRDTPPPANAKKVEQRNIGANTIQTSQLPYSIQQAIKNHPVTLWTFDCGDPCSKATAYLGKRGIPYTTRHASKESDAMKKAVGGHEAPALVVGSTVLRGYSESAWDSALDNAGYPRTPIAGLKPPAAAKAETPAKGEAAAKGDAVAKGTNETTTKGVPPATK